MSRLADSLRPAAAAVRHGWTPQSVVALIAAVGGIVVPLLLREPPAPPPHAGAPQGQVDSLASTLGQVQVSASIARTLAADASSQVKGLEERVTVLEQAAKSKGKKRSAPAAAAGEGVLSTP